MSKHSAHVTWSRNGATFSDGHYSRGHTWSFDGGVTVPASSSPESVRLPYSVEAAVDPEEALVAALSSCHMLFFLAFAKKAGFVVDTYDDEAFGTLGKDADGRISMTDAVLRPRIAFTGNAPTVEQLARLHHEAHEACYVANSVKTKVRVETA